MYLTFQNALRAGAVITAFSLFLGSAQAKPPALPQDSKAINQMKDNLMVVLRESQGANRLENPRVRISPLGIHRRHACSTIGVRSCPLPDFLEYKHTVSCTFFSRPIFCTA